MRKKTNAVQHGSADYYRARVSELFEGDDFDIAPDALVEGVSADGKNEDGAWVTIRVWVYNEQDV